MKRRVIWALLPLLTLAACAAGSGVNPTEVLPTDTGVPSRHPVATATPRPASPSSVAPTPQASRSSPSRELLTGPATVAVDQLRVRTSPSLGSPQVSFSYGDYNVVVDVQLEMYAGMPVWLLDEAPVVSDGLSWRKIAVSNVLYNDGSILVGWVADAAPDGSAWLEPFSTECPVIVDATIDHEDLDALRRMSILGPACFGGRSLTFAAYWPQLSPGAGLGGLCPGPEPRWLLCTNIHYAHVNVTRDTGWVFPVYAPEGPETLLGDRGQWLVLSGHFDDPAARECAAAAADDQTADQLEMFCRTRFVLESATPASAP